jgi:hypothetical protein
MQMRFHQLMMALLLCLALPAVLRSQQSILVNFGSATCTNSTSPSFSLIRQPFGTNPLVLAQCDMKAQLPDYFSVFIAYNPKDNKLYVCDNRTGLQSRIWRIDAGLPTRIACPPSIPVTPTFTHSYVSNNFEFDNNGDLWSLAAYDLNTGQCRMDKFDVETGAIINTRILQFPAGNFPTTIFSGDITILPNGRMFATLGSNPSRLYEILNYSSTSGNATAVFLQTMPLNCYGIAYLNGELEITGSNLVNDCYYYRYSIADNTLSAARPFQNLQAPIDNTSLTPTLGTTKQLLQSTLVNASTADLTYEVFIRNMGNVILNDINIEENLEDAFGVGNVSNVSIEFAPGGNPAGLVLSPSYNAVSQTWMFNTGQSLPNQTTGSNYFAKILLRCRVSNLQPNKVYLNNVIGRATINNEVDRINISDSSNNGPSTAVDPNNDGNPTGVGENTPTPFSLGVLPVKFLQVQALRQQRDALVKWEIATPTNGAAYFLPQFSTDGNNWQSLEKLPITNIHLRSYQMLHSPAPAGTLYYRIQQADVDGKIIYSSVVMLNALGTQTGVLVYPNPVRQNGNVNISGAGISPASIQLRDANGRLLRTATMSTGMYTLSTTGLPAGVYYVQVQSAQGISTCKITIVQ